jgi:hypothetical protein
VASAAAPTHPEAVVEATHPEAVVEAPLAAGARAAPHPNDPHRAVRHRRRDGGRGLGWPGDDEADAADVDEAGGIPPVARQRLVHRPLRLFYQPLSHPLLKPPQPADSRPGRRRVQRCSGGGGPGGGTAV